MTKKIQKATNQIIKRETIFNMKTSNLLFYILMALAMVSWGSSWINAKVLSNYINANELIVYRYIITSITMIPVLIYFKESFKIDIKSLALSFGASIFLIFYSIVFFLGTKYGTAGVGGAFVTTFAPIVTFLLLALFFKKTIKTKDFIALFLGAIGVMTILNIWQFELNQIFTKANLYFILAAIFWPVLTIISSKSNKIKAIVFSFYMYIITTVLSLFFTDFSSGNIFNFDIIFWINLLNISVISTTFATSIYFIAVSKLGTKEASSFIFLVPFNVILLSNIFLDEPIYFTTILGTILTISAVWTLNNVKLPKFTKKK